LELYWIFESTLSAKEAFRIEVGIKYSVNELIGDVISYCAWSCYFCKISTR